MGRHRRSSSPSYTPVDGDVGYHLRATASYTDGHGPGKTAQAASTQTVQAGANRPPELDSATATREVPENTAAGQNIGAPFLATDQDTGDTLTYSLGGTDAASFGIIESTGQLQTKNALDFEIKSTYTVTVTATDQGSLSDITTVTVTVANVDETPVVTGNSPHRLPGERHHGRSHLHRRRPRKRPDYLGPVGQRQLPLLHQHLRGADLQHAARLRDTCERRQRQRISSHGAGF